MAKTLVLAEKPSVGKEIARVLGCKKASGGYFMGGNYIVTWALGHLVTLVDPEYYGEQYKIWSMDTLPMLPQKMALTVIPQTAKQFGVVKKLLHSPEVSSLVIATDAGREGELVARWIIDKAGYRGPIKRLWISSQTDKAIKEGFQHLKDGKEYWNLYQSAVARAEADWLVGLNVTRALTCKYNAQLNAGRVQTPTLAMIVRREEEIKKFVPRDYYQLRADLGRFFVTYQDAKKQTAIFDKDKAETLASKIKGKECRCTEIKETLKSVSPPMLYDLTELQRDANKLYGMSPKETLSVMQRLYETHKALTYPRTDSRYLTDDIVPTLPERLRAVSIGELAPIVSDITRSRRKIAGQCVNNKKVSDHHAIIPTEQRINLIDLSQAGKRIYLLVVKRFLTCFYPNYHYKSVRADFLCEGERFYATGRIEMDKGWKAVYQTQDEDENEEQNLPTLHRGDSFLVKLVQVKALKTAPPARYTEATLLSAMENPSKFIEDKKMKEYIGGGLGTPATRADIIDKLYNAFYIEKRGNSVVPTSKAMQLIDIVPHDLREPLLTATWEQQLEEINRGKLQKNVFIDQIKGYTKKLVKDVESSELTFRHDNLTTNVCPVCGKFMLKVKGKRGTMLVCEDRSCGHRETVSMESNVRCPNCHKKMEIFGQGETRNYVCRCGFRERVNKFHEKHVSAGASKKAVQQYLRNQNKKEEKPQKSAFQLALEKAQQGK